MTATITSVMIPSTATPATICKMVNSMSDMVAASRWAGTPFESPVDQYAVDDEVDDDHRHPQGHPQHKEDVLKRPS